ncbi:uncharacterized protein LOC130097707 [Rhinichthys klamathensis goyatoka]|uniref:uncharacterized protein LOC130097707 n=1 Tax=Rhinichthys klamathensis goyatoka TaxID=3034132 RepID=UPI0024B5A706|nr:uncharacterized protein LOC130097707 [Rhinichthys klamathensis goyatoka]
MSDKCDLCLLGLIVLSSLLTGTSGEDDTDIFISSGENVRLPCNNALSKCKSTTWNYNRFSRSQAVELIAGGKVKDNTGRHARLSLGSDCSLIIKSVTEEDSGLYTCQQYVNDRKQGSDARVSLHAQDHSTTAVIPVHITNSIQTPEPNTKVIGISVAAVAVLLLALLWLIFRKTAREFSDLLLYVCCLKVKDENEHKGTNETNNMSIPPAARANEQTDDHVFYTEVTFSNKNPVKSLNDDNDIVTYAAIRGREDQPHDELYASVNKNKTVTNKH